MASPSAITSPAAALLLFLSCRRAASLAHHPRPPGGPLRQPRQLPRSAGRLPGRHLRRHRTGRLGFAEGGRDRAAGDRPPAYDRPGPGRLSGRRPRHHRPARLPLPLTAPWPAVVHSSQGVCMHRAWIAGLILSVAACAQDVDIPFQKFVLPNGLTLIVHEDHKAPIVAVNVWYHVGSKNEQPGQDRLRPPVRAPDVQRQRALQRPLLRGHGAHRRHRPERHHQRRPHQLFRERARPPRWTTRSGWSPTAWATWSARSTRQTLDQQRGVVQNEKRQGENEPYGLVRGARSRRTPTRPAIRTRGPSSAPWRTSTPPRSTT